MLILVIWAKHQILSPTVEFSDILLQVRLLTLFSFLIYSKSIMLLSSACLAFTQIWRRVVHNFWKVGHQRCFASKLLARQCKLFWTSLLPHSFEYYCVPWNFGTFTTQTLYVDTLQIAVPASLHLLRPPGQRVQDGGAQGEEDCLLPHQRKFRGNIHLLFVTNNLKDLSNTS